MGNNENIGAVPAALVEVIYTNAADWNNALSRKEQNLLSAATPTYFAFGNGLSWRRDRLLVQSAGRTSPPLGMSRGVLMRDGFSI
jgi:hypothetical protein